MCNLGKCEFDNELCTTAKLTNIEYLIDTFDKGVNNNY